jgi:hypothetical protein
MHALSGCAIAKKEKSVPENPTRAQRLSLDRSLKDVWNELAEAANNDLTAPYLQKLTLLAQLKIADAVASYTMWLMIMTVVIVLCAAVQTVAAVLTYMRRDLRPAPI